MTWLNVSACLAAVAVVAGLACAGVPAGVPAGSGELTAVPFTAVRFTDHFWARRIETNRTVSIPHNLRWCQKTGRISNFAKAAGLMKGKFEGIYFNDSDLYKVLEGCAYSLALHPDPVLEKRVDGIIDLIVAAQQKDGYLNTYFTLAEPGKRWTDFNKHELYCAGHLFEAAVAYYHATGKRKLLDAACRYADYINSVFGPGPNKRHDVPGHEEIELALVRLARATGQQKYFRLAKFFIDQRGNKAGRSHLYGSYCQDQVPLVQQKEPVGHAVRAMYFFSGATDVAAATDNKADIAALDRLWNATVHRKMYVTGGIGSTHRGEAFGTDYQLPNESAYCETCASVGMALWNHRMNLLHADAKYADILERVVYNAFLAGYGMNGKLFFYVNPLASSGNHHRQPFFGCACCPTNVERFIPSLGGYVYATDSDGIYVNLYAASTGKVARAGQAVTLRQTTDYPWEGQVRLAVQVDKPARFALHLRIPCWVLGRPVDGGLYRFEAGAEAAAKANPVTIKVNGQAVDTGELVRGYAVLDRTWKRGDVVELDLPMTIHRVYANAHVQADVGRVALQRGPIVYCLEAVDNGGGVNQLFLPPDAKLSCDFRKNLLDGVTVIHATARERLAGSDKTQPVEMTAVPYYAWDHRAPGEMAVWIAENPDLARAIPAPTIASQSKPSASHCNPSDSASAMNDQIEPKNSDDQSIPRLTWWDHRGTAEWAQYDFKAPAKVSSVEVYWFDDTGRGQCRTPQSWKLLYKDGADWKPVPNAGEAPTKTDCYNKLTFDPVETTALRIEVQLKPNFSGGILEWKVE